MKDKKEITSDIDKIIGLNNEVTDNTHMDLVDEIVDYIESELVELKEQQPEQSAKNMKILSEMANQDELLADMELEQSAEEILYKHTCCINPYKKEDILDAMQEYRQQGMSTEDEINVYFDKLFREGRLSKREINNRVEGAKYVLNKQKGE